MKTLAQHNSKSRLLKSCAALVVIALFAIGLFFKQSTVAANTGKTEPRHNAEKYQRPRDIPYPKENFYSSERELLGRTLFFDPRLSGSNWISCASCHNPGFSWGDGLSKGIGHGMKELGRRTPTILNLAWAELLFWDGRASSLEEQALGPIASAGEMNMNLDQMVGKISSISGYQELFKRAYPGESISKETVAKAIALFERGVVSGKSPFDDWIGGNDQAMSAEARRGYALFNEKADCVKCHNTWRFTDDGFHDIGLTSPDNGRGNILKEIEVMQHAFKTPTLRNVDRRAPYMHDGSLGTLEQVIEFYNKGGAVKRQSVSPEIKPLNLTDQEKHDLLAFLRALTSVDKPVEVPSLPR